MVRLIFFVALFAYASAELRRIPLIKKQNHVLSIENIRVERNHMMEKYHLTLDDDSQECVVNMDNSINNQFYAKISVGTPPQVLNAIFDTTAFVAYLSTNCSDDSCAGFNVKASSTAKIQFSNQLVYVDYSNIEEDDYNYTIVEDVCNLGINVDLTFGVNNLIFDNVDMVFGLGPQKDTQLLAPPIYYLYQQQVLDSLAYSLYYDNKSDTDFGGHVILGGVDPSLYSGELTTMKFISNDGAITVPLASFSINGVVTVTKSSAIIDSGFNMISVPLLTFIKINQQIDGIIDEEGNYFVQCDTVDSLPDVILSIGSNQYVLTPENYILRVSKGLTPCMSAFTYLNSQTFHLGLPFLKTVYTAVNLKEQTIGFATLA